MRSPFHFSSSKRVLFLSFALLLGGCDQKPDSASSSATKPAPADPTPPPKDAVPPKALETIADEDGVKKAVMRWVEAQNQGDFAAYQKLYAEKFTGQKRSEKRVVNFGREGWMADRKKMFQAPFTVAANGVSVGFAPHVAIATFEQSWRSATYQDRGTKRLIFVKGSDGLAISREEMLTSETSSSAQVLAIPFEKAALASKTIDSFALLIPGKAEAKWAKGAPRYVSNQRAELAVDKSALPAALQKLADATYEVFDRQGKRCETKVRGFVLQVHVIPHFGSVQYWEGTMNPGDPVIPNEQRAKDLLQMASGPSLTETDSPGLRLALEMEPNKTCAEPVWGRVIAPDSPKPWPVTVPQAADIAALPGAVARHPFVVELNTLGKDGLDPPGDWFEQIVLPTRRLISSDTGTQLVFAEVIGRGGCGVDLPTSMGILFRKQGDAIVPLPLDVKAAGPVLAAVDLNGDGEVELISEIQILSKGVANYEVAIDHAPLFLDCPC